MILVKTDCGSMEDFLILFDSLKLKISEYNDKISSYEKKIASLTICIIGDNYSKVVMRGCTHWSFMNEIFNDIEYDNDIVVIKIHNGGYKSAFDAEYLTSSEDYSGIPSVIHNFIMYDSFLINKSKKEIDNLLRNSNQYKDIISNPKLIYNSVLRHSVGVVFSKQYETIDHEEPYIYNKEFMTEICDGIYTNCENLLVNPSQNVQIRYSPIIYSTSPPNNQNHIFNNEKNIDSDKIITLMGEDDRILRTFPIDVIKNNFKKSIMSENQSNGLLTCSDKYKIGAFLFDYEEETFNSVKKAIMIDDKFDENFSKIENLLNWKDDNAVKMFKNMMRKEHNAKYNKEEPKPEVLPEKEIQK